MLNNYEELIHIWPRIAIKTHSFDLVKADICDVNVPLVVHRQSVWDVEHSLSEGVEGVSGVRIEKEDGVLINDFLLL